ncbi:MAG: hypothetical protein [Bacteriophage sp.]|nr:MAG: hypothetical protein [Bacteriophage sp.]
MCCHLQGLGPVNDCMTLLIFFLELHMASPNIASTVFGTTPNDSVVTADIYGNAPAKPTNNRQGRVDNQLLNAIAGGDNLGGSIFKSIADLYLGGQLTSKDLAIKNLSNSLGINVGALSHIEGELGDIVLRGSGFYDTGIGKVVDGLVTVTTGNSMSKSISGFRDLSVTINGAKAYIKNLKDVNSLTGLANLISTIGGDNAVIKALNLTEVASTIVNLNKVANAYRLPAVFDKLIKSVSSNSDAKNVAALVAAGTSTYGDLGLTNSILDHLSGSELLAARPTVITDTLSTFTANATYPTASIAAGQALINTLNRINPHWSQICVDVANDVWRDNLKVFQSFSDFARRCMLLTGQYQTQLMICNAYQSKTFYTLAKMYYPYIAITQ